MSLPMVDCFALAWRWAHRASFGNQNTFSARYSSGSSAAVASSFRSASSFASKAFEMCLGNQPQRHMLVIGRLEVLAELVSREKQLRLEAEISAVAVLVGRLPLRGLPGSRHMRRVRGIELSMRTRVYAAICHGLASKIIRKIYWMISRDVALASG